MTSPEQRANEIIDKMQGGHTRGELIEIIAAQIREAEKEVLIAYATEQKDNFMFGPSVSLMVRNAELENEIEAVKTEAYRAGRESMREEAAKMVTENKMIGEMHRQNHPMITYEIAKFIRSIPLDPVSRSTNEESTKEEGR